MNWFAAFLTDSFLPGYKELTFVFLGENVVFYRVVPDSDPRLANLVICTPILRHSDHKLICTDIIGRVLFDRCAAKVDRQDCTCSSECEKGRD